VIPILIAKLIGSPRIYLDKKAKSTIDKTLTVLQPHMVLACAPPVDFLMKPTLENTIRLSYKVPVISPIITTMRKSDVT
jgi:hypothetical protein